MSLEGTRMSHAADFVMPTDVLSSLPIDSPASPAEQNAQSSIMTPTKSTITINNNIDSESEHGFTLGPKMMDQYLTRGIRSFSLCPQMIQTQMSTGTMTHYHSLMG